jgi:glucosyl-3-phosphoglycerate synthase
MTDFHQEGIFTNLHSLYEANDDSTYMAILEKRLEEYSRHIQIALLLPSLYSEIENATVVNRIISEIKKVQYIHNIVVTLGGAREEAQFQEAKSFFGKLRTADRDFKVVWVEGPRIQGIFRELEDRQIPTGVKGKGQSVWIALGYLFAREDNDVVALHDCDIVTYDRVLLGRLIEPTANPNNDFEFCKGYYARISPTEKAMKGRVTRLFVTPFVDAMRALLYDRGYHELVRFFRYHHSFKYPLAGEFSINTRLARGINIAYDWGLEVSTLSEVYDRVIPRKIAQIDLIPNYEHKHQALSPDDEKRGLHRMVVDISKFYLNYMRSHGVALDDAFVEMVRRTYYANAQKFLKSYADDSETNCLVYDRYEEELTVRYFRDFISTAWSQCKNQQESTLIPSWNRVVQGLPDIYDKLLDAVEADNA